MDKSKIEENRGRDIVASPAPTLYVDVDGTLLVTDLLVESTLRLLFRNPFYIFIILLWTFRGKSTLKNEVSKRVSLDVSVLPYSGEFKQWLMNEVAGGRPVILASAASEKYVREIAVYLGLSRDVIASNLEKNRAGKDKLAAIRAHAGGLPFDYAGNARPDLHVWKAARHAILVNSGRSLEASARQIVAIEKVFHRSTRPLRAWVKGLRIHQWIKNLLLAIPLLTSFEFQYISNVVTVGLAIVAFSLVASSTYLVNDLVDLDADRLHPRKSKRALASGDISILRAIFVGLFLLFAGLELAAWISINFLGAVLIYLVATLTYSLKLKRFMLIDVSCLAGLYTWRIIAGAVAIHVEMSNWLAAFSLFIFFSLALVKRCAELVSVSARGGTAIRGRDYRTSDSIALTGMGIASGFLAVLVLALFIDQPTTAAQYTSPRFLWLLCPLLMYWIGRLWIKTARGEMHDDPIVYSARDGASWVVFGAFVCVTLFAR